MPALIEACDISTSVKNSGIGCSAAMLASAQFLVAPLSLKIPADALNDFPAWVNTQMHAPKGSRVYSVGGNSAPFRTITDNDAQDVIQTFDDGSQVFITSGFANRSFEMTEGGNCNAQFLRSLLNSGYGFVELDKTGQVMLKYNTDGTYGFFPAFLGGATPKAATFKTKYVNVFRISYDPDIYINSGKIFKGAEAVLNYSGLHDAKLLSAATATTTTIKVFVKDDCGNADLTGLVGTPLATIGNWIVTKKSDGTPATVSAVAIENGYIKITGTFTTGTVYHVALALPAVLLTNDVEGYDGEVQSGIDVTIP